MQAKVTLLARVNQGNGSYPFVPVEVTRRGIRLPVEWKGKVYLPGSIVGFYVRYSENGKRPKVNLGKDPIDAFARYQSIDRDHARSLEGKLPLEQDNPLVNNQSERTLSFCAQEFEKDKASLKTSPYTITTYMKSLEYFVKSTNNKSIDQIKREDICKFIDWLGANMKKRKFGHQNNTLRTKLNHVRNFMKHFGVTMPLEEKEWPAEIPKRKEKYSVSAVGKLLKVCVDEDEKDFVHFFLKTGFRNSEVRYAQYRDINFEHATINTSHKLVYNWTPKDKGPREADIFIGDLAKRIKARMLRYGATPESLIFPNADGKPNRHLDRIIHRIAKRAGIPGRIELHKFRKTFATLIAANLSIEDARLYLGHTHVETTQSYLTADDGTPAQKRSAIKSMFKTFGD